MAQSSDLGRVQITGSRILSANAVAAAPVQVVSSEDIAATGAATVQDLLAALPVMGAPSINRTNSNFQTSSVGVATIDLRNLGSDRTLVLVNGRRHVSGIPGTAAVDLNSIPTDFIDRVEILTGGASSLYGSDAVAGVVNIILKKSMQGLALDASIGRSSAGDDKSKKFSLTGGGSFAGGGGSIMTHLSLTQNGAVYTKDRAISAVDQLSKGTYFTGDAADAFVAQAPYYSSYAPAGRFWNNQTGSSRTFNANGDLISFSTNGPAGDGVGATGFNRSAFRTIAVPTDRALFSTVADLNIGGGHKAFFEGTYAYSRTKSRLEPFPFAADDMTEDGVIPAEFMVNGVKVANPLIPAALLDFLSPNPDTGLKDYYFTRRMSDVDVRSQTAARDTFRFVTGFKGDLNKSFNYELYAGYGTTKEGQTGTGQINVQSLYQALQVIPDANGNPVCLSEVARFQGCVPADIFGANKLSAEASNYIHAPSSLNTRVAQTVLGLTVSGELGKGPTGDPIGVAGGLEYRKESSSETRDALSKAGLNAGNKIPDTAGSFSVSEAFAEGRIPLVKNSAAAKSLDAILSVRNGNYSTVGSTNSYNTGLDWAINPTVRMRVSLAKSTRAPNIAELYTGPSQTFPTGLRDPCLGVKATDTSATAVNCLAAAGVATNVTANGEFTLNQSDIQGVSGYDQGNPNLKAEEGTSKTLGLVITPKGGPLSNFVFTADYFDIGIDNAVSSPGRQYLLDQCYKFGDAASCAFITRRPANIGANSAGSLEFINQGAVNAAEARTRGLDLTAAHTARVGAGSLTSRLTYTRLFDLWQKTTPTSDISYAAGEVGAPKNKWVLNLGYDVGSLSLTAAVNFIGKSYLDDDFLSGMEWDKEDVAIKAYKYVNVLGNYKLNKKSNVYLGITNLFNTQPPFMPTGIPGGNTGVETAASVYDAIGRRIFVGVKHQF